MGVTDKKYGVSVSFYRKLAFFRLNRRLTPLYFEQFFLKKIKHVKSYI
jgi:hypothetical protein